MPRTHIGYGFSFLLLTSIHAAPAILADSPGITVTLNGARLLHRAPVEYPGAARQNRVQGTIVIEATLDERGNVADARVVSWVYRT